MEVIKQNLSPLAKFQVTEFLLFSFMNVSDESCNFVNVVDIPLISSYWNILTFIQLHIVVNKTLAKVVIDCKQVGEKAINASANITVDGVEVLGRMVRSRGPNGNSAPVSGYTIEAMLLL